MAKRQKAPRYITQNMLNRCTAAAIVVLHAPFISTDCSEKSRKRKSRARAIIIIYRIRGPYPRVRISVPPRVPDPNAGIARCAIVPKPHQCGRHFVHPKQTYPRNFRERAEIQNSPPPTRKETRALRRSSFLPLFFLSILPLPLYPPLEQPLRTWFARETARSSAFSSNRFNYREL